MKIPSAIRMPHEREQMQTASQEASHADISTTSLTGAASAAQGAHEPAIRPEIRPDREALAAMHTRDVLQRYARAPSTTLHSDPHLTGVLRDATGHAHIVTGVRTYAVMYDGDHGTRRVRHADDPAKHGYPVRRDEPGNWRVHHEVGLMGGAPGIPQRVKDDAKALLRDGWSLRGVARTLGISAASVARIGREIVMPRTAPLASHEFLENAVAQLTAGIPAAQVALDLGVRPQTVELIAQTLAHAGAAPLSAWKFRHDLQNNGASDGLSRLRLAPELKAKAQALLREGWTARGIGDVLKISVSTINRIKRRTDLASSVEALPRSAESPQPGTSTGGWTHPSGVRSSPALAGAEPLSAHGESRAGSSGIAEVPASTRLQIEHSAQNATRPNPWVHAGSPARDMPQSRPSVIVVNPAYRPSVRRSMPASQHSVNRPAPEEAVRRRESPVSDMPSRAAPGDRTNSDER